MGSRTRIAASVLAGLLIVSCARGDDTGGTDAFPAGEPVDLLVLTDSSGSGIAERYAEAAAAALDREVRVHDRVRPGSGITATLSLMRTTLADLVADAEIIVVYGAPLFLEGDLPKPDIVSCFREPGTQEPPPVVATVEDWHAYRDVLDQVYDEIWGLRDGLPTIIRTYDVPIGLLARWRELDIESECVANWLVQAQVIREAAEAHGAGFVSMIEVFNGPDHDEDPIEKGWMPADDVIHTTEVGQDVIADTLAAHGFELSTPPG